MLERDQGKALAAHSTLNRLQLSAEGIDLRYHKIQPQPEQIEALLIKRGVKAIPPKSFEMVLDLTSLMIRSMAARKGLLLTATIASTVTCRFTVFAVTFRWLPSCGARFEAGALYEKPYCARGDMENRIKEQQLNLFADHTGTHWMAFNQLRLWFSALLICS